MINAQNAVPITIQAIDPLQFDALADIVTGLGAVLTSVLNNNIAYVMMPDETPPPQQIIDAIVAIQTSDLALTVPPITEAQALLNMQFELELQSEIMSEMMEVLSVL